MPTPNGSKREWALYYRSIGFSIIPLCTPTLTGSCAIHGSGCKSAGKTPLIKWEKYQNERASIAILNEWWNKWPEANIGIVTGAISSLVVVDVEFGGSLEGLIPTVISKTGGGGWHYYYKYPNQKVGNSTRIKELTDIRGDGGYVVAPPSLHNSGHAYGWEVTPNNIYAGAPDWVLNKPKTIVEQHESVVNGVSNGSRNQSATSIVGKFLSRYPQSEWETFVWPALVGWNKQNNPPLEESELRLVFESIAKKEKESASKEKDSKAKSAAGKLLELISQEGVLLFHDQFRDPYIAVYGDGREILRLGSKLYKRWVSGIAWKKLGYPVNSETMQMVNQVLESKAVFESEQKQLNVRTAWYKDKIWYDLGDGKVVKIDKDGWQIIEQPPIIFRRMPHQKTHPLPTKDGSIASFLNFANIQDPNERILLQVFLIASFVYGFPHPVIVLHGSQGSAKTTLCRLIKGLIDPSQIETMSAPDSEREFIQLASHHWILFFDNLTGLSGWLSDAISRASTGDGFSKRELYSDDEDKIYRFQIVVGLNGINSVVTKPDLLDRSILLNLARIPEDRRMTEKEVRDSFSKALPGLLGSVFTSLSYALNKVDHVTIPNLPRMADFAKWGCAIAQSLGYSESEFLNAYTANVARQNDEAIEANPVAGPLLTFMDKCVGDWEGTAAELLSELLPIAEELRVDIKEKLWPKDARWLWKRIEISIPNFEANGFKITRKHNGHKRNIQIWRIKKVDSDNSTVSNQALPTTQNSLLPIEN